MNHVVPIMNWLQWIFNSKAIVSTSFSQEKFSILIIRKLLHHKSLQNDSHLTKHLFIFIKIQKCKYQNYNTNICFTVTNISYTIQTTYDIWKLCALEVFLGTPEFCQASKEVLDILCGHDKCFIFSRPICPPSLSILPLPSPAR